MKFYGSMAVFLTVYRLKSFTDAAKKLGLTQSAISIHIKNLEHYFGKTLFERTGKTIIATKDAQDLVLLVSDSYNNIDSVITNFSTYTNIAGTIKIGCANDLARYSILSKIGMCLEKQISLIVNDHINTDEKINHALLHEEIDFGITTSKTFIKDLVYIKLYEDTLSLVGTERWESYLDKTCPENTYQSLNSLRWLAYDSELSLIRPYIESVFNNSSSFINPHLLYKDLRGLLYAVAGGYGVTVLPGIIFIPQLKKEAIKIIYSPTVQPTYTAFLVYKSGRLLNKRMSFFKDIMLQNINLYETEAWKNLHKNS
ncbi:LysR family transcriptional regulator [Legionella beliardensis]|uniref:LysR family transcriptional regulator n=1 Tax=Legionella beliardensis TaxID=91822 RepID=A0A378HYM3_9GAMM|nr:LysR family transcriptional regulator [Legionella beliardensis]STX27999.1 LysR family transcriptional regulator [Legionella beliardensis]